MADRNGSWLEKLAQVSTIAQLLLALGITGALTIGLQAALGAVLALSTIERVLLGVCGFVIALAIVLAGFNKYVLNRQPSGKEGRQLRKENRQLKAQNKRLLSENEWLRAETPQPNDEELIERCYEWSNELLPFLENRAREDPQTGMLSGERISYNNETIAQYNARFARPVGALLNDLALRGWITAEERKQFENPIILLTIQQIANRLAALSGRSNEG